MTKQSLQTMLDASTSTLLDEEKVINLTLTAQKGLCERGYRPTLRLFAATWVVCVAQGLLPPRSETLYAKILAEREIISPTQTINLRDALSATHFKFYANTSTLIESEETLKIGDYTVCSPLGYKHDLGPYAQQRLYEQIIYCTGVYSSMYCNNCAYDYITQDPLNHS